MSLKRNPSGHISYKLSNKFHSCIFFIAIKYNKTFSLAITLFSTELVQFFCVSNACVSDEHTCTFLFSVDTTSKDKESCLTSIFIYNMVNYSNINFFLNIFITISPIAQGHQLVYLMLRNEYSNLYYFDVDNLVEKYSDLTNPYVAEKFVLKFENVF